MFNLEFSDRKILSRLAAKQAIIMEDKRFGGMSYAAFPKGDRRCRPISWVNHDDIKRYISSGVLRPSSKGYVIEASALKRGVHDDYKAQHRELDTQPISGASGGLRPVTVNRHTRQPLRVLASRLGRNGDAFLKDSEITAGERFSNDYAKAGYGSVSSQNYMSTGSQSSMSNYTEDAAIAAIDGRRHVKAAIDYMGSGLSAAVIAICCKDMGLEELEQAEGWGKRSGKTVLKLGLSRLVAFYGTEPG